MKPWNCLVRALIQGHIIECTLTVHTAFEDKAEKMAKTIMINSLRRAGIWAEITEGPEGEKIYNAPSMEHITFVKFIELREMDLTFPPIEQEVKFKASTKTKRRTSGEVALEKKQEVKKKVKVKGDKLQPIVDYFIEAKNLKDAAKDLNEAYQVVRYRVKQIKDKGCGGIPYDVIELETDGNKTIQIKRKALI